MEEHLCAPPSPSAWTYFIKSIKYLLILLVLYFRSSLKEENHQMLRTLVF